MSGSYTNYNLGYGTVAVFSVSAFVSLALTIGLGALAIAENQYVLALVALLLATTVGIATFSGAKFYTILQANKSLAEAEPTAADNAPNDELKTSPIPEREDSAITIDYDDEHNDYWNGQSNV